MIEYKGYHLYEASALLLFDILQTQQEILFELKKLNERLEPVEHHIEIEPVSTIVEPEKPEVTKPRQRTKKKTPPKKATK